MDGWMYHRPILQLEHPKTPKPHELFSKYGVIFIDYQILKSSNAVSIWQSNDEYDNNNYCTSCDATDSVAHALTTALLVFLSLFNVFFSLLYILQSFTSIMVDFNKIFALFVNFLVYLLSHCIGFDHEFFCVVEGILSLAYHSFVEIDLTLYFLLFRIQKLLSKMISLVSHTIMLIIICSVQWVTLTCQSLPSLHRKIKELLHFNVYFIREFLILEGQIRKGRV